MISASVLHLVSLKPNEHLFQQFGNRNFTKELVNLKNSLSVVLLVVHFANKRCRVKVMNPVANLIKHITIVNYDPRVVLTTNLPILRP